MTADDDKQLFIYEEIMFLFLGGRSGTVAMDFAPHIISGAIMAELLLEERIVVEGPSKVRVNIQDETPVGDAILDDCLRKIVRTKQQDSMQTWVTRLAENSNLRHRVARRLCDRGILRADEETILFLFTRKFYPEVNPEPERKITDRLRQAIFSDDPHVEPRTTVLISLAYGTNLLNRIVGHKDYKNRKGRIEQIVKGELTGQATRQAIATYQATVAVATMMPAIMMTSFGSP